MALFRSYNEELLNMPNEVNLFDYISEINTRSNTIDSIHFNRIMEIQQFIGRDECCIPHKYLYIFEVLTGKEDSDRINRLLTELKFKYINGIDYLVHKLGDKVSGQIHYSNKYLLHPNAFRKIIMRCQNKEIYATYFTFIDDCCKFYNDYQLALKEKYIMSLQLKITEYTSTIAAKDTTIAEKEDSITALRRELAQYAATNQQQLDEINDVVNEIRDDLHVTNIILDKSLEDRSLKPDKNDLTVQFVIVSSDDEEDLREYYAIRRQKKTMDYAISKIVDNYPRMVLRVECVPNAVYEWTNIKNHETLKDNIEHIGKNSFMLNCITEEEFINRIKLISAEKQTKHLPKRSKK